MAQLKRQKKLNFGLLRLNLDPFSWPKFSFFGAFFGKNFSANSMVIVYLIFYSTTFQEILRKKKEKKKLDFHYNYIKEGTN
jgi:hypothetical protein